MRHWLRLTLLGLLLACLAGGAWCALNRQRLARAWTAYRLGSAADFSQVRAILDRLEDGPDADNEIRALVAHWGTGSPRFDLYLAWYVGQQGSSERFRATFSRELSWRDELLPRWGHYWIWRAPQPPNAELAGLASYLDLLSRDTASTSPAPSIDRSLPSPRRALTWREVLDVQALLTIGRQPQLARRLDPDNWHGRYQAWRQNSCDLSGIQRPETPFPDWQGPAPEPRRLPTE